MDPLLLNDSSIDTISSDAATNVGIEGTHSGNNSDDQGSSSSAFDFFGASEEPKWPAIRDAPTRKTLLICKDGEETSQLIAFLSGETETIFTKISDMFKFEEKRLIVMYPLKTSNGQRMVTLKYNDSLSSSRETFYCQVEQMVTLVVKEEEKTDPRRKQLGEMTFVEFKNRGTIDKISYTFIQKNHCIGKKFLEKSDLVRVLLGSKSCVNLLNPAMFLCPVKLCNEYIKLNYFNNTSAMLKHLKYHALEDNDDGLVCKLLMKRYYFLHNQNWITKICQLLVAEIQFNSIFSHYKIMYIVPY